MGRRSSEEGTLIPQTADRGRGLAGLARAIQYGLGDLPKLRADNPPPPRPDWEWRAHPAFQHVSAAKATAEASSFIGALLFVDGYSDIK